MRIVCLDFSTEWDHYSFSCDKTLIQRAINEFDLQCDCP